MMPVARAGKRQRWGCRLRWDAEHTNRLIVQRTFRAPTTRCAGVVAMRRVLALWRTTATLMLALLATRMLASAGALLIGPLAGLLTVSLCRCA